MRWIDALRTLGWVAGIPWLIGATTCAYADSTALTDVTGDGQIHVLAFGDSITYGVGDGTNPGDYVEAIMASGTPRGYPQRLSADLGIVVSNAGLPGERFLQDGVERLPGLVVGTDVDTVVFMEGTNDAVHRIEGSDYRIGLQKIVNIVRAEGRNMVINTLPPPAAIHGSLAPYTALYSSIARELSVLNGIPLGDVEQKFVTTCSDMESCQLYNIPEGLHPNTVGYDAIAEVVESALAGGVAQ